MKLADGLSMIFYALGISTALSAIYVFTVKDTLVFQFIVLSLLFMISGKVISIGEQLKTPND